MIIAKALRPIINNNSVVGYVLVDSKGNNMDIGYKSLVEALQRKTFKVDNLKFNSEGKLVMIGDIQSEDKVNNPESKVDVVRNERSQPKLNNKQGKNSVKEQSDKKEPDKKEPDKKEPDKKEPDKMSRMHYLVDLLNRASLEYYQKNNEIMSNKEYDTLYDELVGLEASTGTVLSNSPTINIGYEVVSALPKENHSEVMMSLAKTKSLDDIKNFIGSRECLLGWKLDGLTVVVTYSNGELVKAVTRGNGTVGELVTPNAKHFKGLPHKIAFKGSLVIRGEAIITYSDFDKINAKLYKDDKYKNPRNLASGSVRQLDSKITASRNVRFFAFTLVNAEDKQFNRVSESYEFMSNLGFNVVEYNLINSSNIDEVIERYTKTVKDKKLDTPVDGLVITYDDIAYGKSLGTTAKTPRHSIAMKWEDEVVETRLVDIEWSASKTGLLNPVAIFDPVDIEGSTVSRASLHNVSIFLGLELGYGDTITVYKANMIIPQVHDNLTRYDTCDIPEQCPVCGGDTEIKEDPNSGVLTLWCTNPDCPAKGHRLLKHFVSRDAMNIDGISGSTLEKLADYGIISDFASIFRVSRHPEIMEIEGFGEKSFINMVNAVDNARKVKLHNLIYALSIPNVGLQTAKLICNKFNNNLVKTVTASYIDLASIPGIGDVIARNFFEYFKNKENVDKFIDLVGELEVVEEEVKRADSSDKMYGKVFCVTGKVYIFPNRDSVKAIIESRGGKLTGSVSKNTDYLITNDTGSGSRKNKAAAELGIPILTEQQFIDEFSIEV